MEKAIIGRKVGMTQVYDEKGLVIPVTVIEAGPMTLIRKKTVDRDGYAAAVVGFEDVREKLVTGPQKGEFKKAGVNPKRIIRELKFDNLDALEVGKDIKCDIFASGEVVDVIGTSKGRGFTGNIKRWNARRLKMTHGTGPVHREVGSTGANSTPSKVIKGLHMPGQYGHERVTVQNLKVVRVDAERNVILIRGAIPGPKGGLVTVRTAVKSK